MRRTSRLIALTATAVVVSGVALAPNAVGTTRPNPHPATRPAIASGKGLAPCKPKFRVVAAQKIGSPKDNTIGALEHVVEADKTHSYAVGLTLTDQTFNGVLDEGTGEKWKLNDHPGRSLNNAYMAGVDASDNDNVWAVGFTLDGTGKGSNGIVLHKTKSGWHNIKVPHTDKTFLTSVATSSPDDVYIGGLTEKAKSPDEVPVILHFNGKKWKRTVFATSGDSFGIVAMTFAGKTLVASISNQFLGNTVTTAVGFLEYLKGKVWTPLLFKPNRSITSISGSSIHDLWGSTQDAAGDATLVYHHTKKWTPTTIADNNVQAVSERDPNPEGIWLAGQATSTDGYALVDVLRSSGPTAASMEVAGNETSEFFGVDAHIPNRVVAVGNGLNTNGSARLIVEQATC